MEPITNNHPDFGHFYLPLDAATVADICRVSLRTAQRWWNGDSRPPYSAIQLVRLVHGGRVMPGGWPEHWRFALGTLQTGSDCDAIRQQDIAAYHWVKNSWYEALALITRTEQQINALLPLLRESDREKLQDHRLALGELRSRDHIAREWRLRQREKHRASGC
ncbi:hypothetical protein [uncultured Microbulbifer sp.]|uniref:hypothetical protein n=1 Tax=uncultured Microbulbifer sp. TaxID=348147 RepID=UPI0025E38695|nr:hypothetical protein [uncultured Microbulbifer sp.]